MLSVTFFVVMRFVWALSENFCVPIAVKNFGRCLVKNKESGALSCKVFLLKRFFWTFVSEFLIS